MSSIYSLCLILITLTIANESSNKDQSTNMIGSALNGYAAILDRIGKIYKLATDSNPSNKQQQEFFAKNRHKIESELLKNAKNKNEKEIINDLLNEYNIFEPVNENENENKFDDYYVPIIDDIFDFKPKIEEEPLNNNNKNNAQYEYIRRRLQQEEHPDITCDNTNTNSNEYEHETDYQFMFEPFINCNVSNNNNNTFLNITEEITTINVTNKPILYSSNCEFMLILNGINGDLQVIASQQTIPMWSSNTNINNINTNTNMYSLQFNSSNGDLIIFNGNDALWTASNTSHWSDSSKIEWELPYNLILSNNIGELYVMDNNSEIKWHSNGIKQNNNMNFRERVYMVNLTDNNNNNNVLFSMLMNVWLITHNQQHFHLYFEYDIPNINESDIIKEYINIMLLEEYKFNVSVYELSSNNIGDTYVIYDPNLPMIYSLVNKKFSDRLSISESHTFLCIDNNTRYFNINFIPFTYNISIQTSENNNYSLLIYEYNNRNMDDIYYYNNTNYSFFIKPWNPCNEGKPVLATNTNRECFIKYDLNNAMNQFNIYKSNEAYSNINMKYIFKSQQCVNNILNGNISSSNSINESIVFPKNFSMELCENYYIQINEFNETLNKTINKQIINKYFNSSYCNVLRNNCTGYYSICLDYTSSICTCYCPRDKKGINCEEFRDYDCKLNILNANMTECELMTQEELNSHGRDDYDVTIDGDKPCFFINENGNIESIIQLNCYFTDSISNSQVWEELIDYKIYTNNYTFNYCLGNETSLFALTLLPPKSILRLKIFNFERIFSDNETYIIPLNISHWSGNKYILHNKSMNTLNNKYKIGGRIYIEYQLWQMDEHNKQQNRINVERRFYDIDNYIIPKSNEKKFNNQQKWFIVIITITIFVFIIYCIWQCNKWCKKLEHEKID